jgi:hypothetical protein
MPEFDEVSVTIREWASENGLAVTPEQIDELRLGLEAAREMAIYQTGWTPGDKTPLEREQATKIEKLECDTALAQMREALEAIVNDQCVRLHHCTPYDSQMFKYCQGCEAENTRQAANSTLSTDFGASTLERIRGLEEKAARLDYLRPEVLWFAQEMERQLRTHDANKGVAGWKTMLFDELLNLLQLEVLELRREYRTYEGSLEGMIHESADVANIAMMVADNAKIAIDAYLKGGGPK